MVCLERATWESGAEAWGCGWCRGVPGVGDSAQLSEGEGVPARQVPSSKLLQRPRGLRGRTPASEERVALSLPGK